MIYFFSKVWSSRADMYDKKIVLVAHSIKTKNKKNPNNF